ncbi:MAG TPA: hypothetical protein EYH18_00530 [Aquifex sp.]|uniref:Uncharacterized protein n=1 Tax=Aquifex aeolicus TaxID=63363 RepID=A0A9D0YR93_AQUAO|nr:hypothetical protein [Aquifex sp.]HIP98479.1 hypothetical protein [Aquifex aeolicus]
MCFFLTLAVLFIFLSTYLVNFFITYLYRQRLADCIFKDRGVLRNFFIVHPLGLYLSSFLWGGLAVLTFLEFFIPPKPFKVLYFLLTLAVILSLYHPLKEKILKYTTPQVADYILFKYLPFSVSLFSAALYAVYLYNFATFGELVPNLNAEAYLKEAYSTYGSCPIIGLLVVLIKMWDYSIGTLLVNSAQLGKDFFLPLLFFTFLKEGVAVWILTQSVLGILIVLRRLFGFPSWV